MPCMECLGIPWSGYRDTCNLKWSKIRAYTEIAVHYTSFMKKTKVRLKCVFSGLVAFSHFQSLSYGDKWQHAAMSEVVGYLRGRRVCSSQRNGVRCSLNRFRACQTGRASFCWRKATRDKLICSTRKFPSNIICPSNTRLYPSYTCLSSSLHICSHPLAYSYEAYESVVGHVRGYVREWVQELQAC